MTVTILQQYTHSKIQQKVISLVTTFSSIKNQYWIIRDFFDQHYSCALQWTVNREPWTVNSEPWTVNRGLGDKLHLVASCIRKNPTGTSTSVHL